MHSSPPADRGARITDATPGIPAGVPRRLAAFALDYLVVLAYLALLTLIGAGLFVAFGSTPSFLANPWVADGLTFLTLVLPVALYFAAGESSSARATWGKRKAGLRVVNARGGRLSFPQALARSLLKLLPWQLAHTSIYHIPGWPAVSGEVPALSGLGLSLVWVLAIAYALSAAVTRTHRTPYDWLSGTFVVWAAPAPGRPG